MNSDRWTTDDEIAYLANLGKHRAQADIGTIADRQARETLLSLYATTADQREDWGEIDRQTVLDFIVMELDRIRRSGKPYEGWYQTVHAKYTSSVLDEA